MVSPGGRYGHRPDLPGLTPHAETLPTPLKHGRPVAPRERQRFRTTLGFILTVEVPLGGHAGTAKEAAERVRTRCREMYGLDHATDERPARVQVMVRDRGTLEEDIEAAYRDARAAWGGYG